MSPKKSENATPMIPKHANKDGKRKNAAKKTKKKDSVKKGAAKKSGAKKPYKFKIVIPKKFDPLSKEHLKITHKVDSNYPRPRKSAYMMFVCSEPGLKFREENVGMKPTEITAAIGAMWRKLSDEDKKVYEELSEQDKIRFENARAAYVRPTGEALDRIYEKLDKARKNEIKKYKKKINKEYEKPTGSKTSFLYFCEVVRGDTVGTTIPECAKKWNLLSEAEKEPFSKLAEEDRLRHEHEMIAWHKKMEKIERRAAEEAAALKAQKKAAALQRKQDRLALATPPPLETVTASA